MLAMTVRAYVRNPARPVLFVPIYFGCARLVEGRTYIGELSGRPKEKESVLGMLRALPELRSRFGKVYVSFGEPAAAPTPCSHSHVPGWVTDSSPSRKRSRRGCRRSALDLARQVMTRINAAACVTPVNLMGTVLLATPRQRIGEADLARQLELYASLLRQAPYSPRVWVTPLDGQSMRHRQSPRISPRIFSGAAP